MFLDPTKRAELAERLRSAEATLQKQMAQIIQLEREGRSDEGRALRNIWVQRMEKLKQFKAQLISQAQQAQAQAQAVLHQSMIFGAPSIMSAPFYGPQMAPPMMMPPQLPSTPPPLHDTAKLNRVDKWRHDVAVEGET